MTAASALIKKLLRPTVWVTAERTFSESFFLLLFAIQAPILGPAAFGLIAAVMVFIGFWEQVLGHAVTEALISIHDIDELHYSTITTFSSLICLIFMFVAIGVAAPFASAFGDPRLVSIIRVMAVLPLIQAFSIAPTAAAQREMQFQSIALRTIACLIAGGAVGLVLAVYGYGAWALVWQAVVQRLVAVVVLWLAVPIRLGFRFSWGHFRVLLAFAVPVTVARVMGWISGQLPRLILAFYLGPADLGLFTIASRLCYIVSQVAILPKTIVARVALRRFAIDTQGLVEAVRRVLLQISMITLPLCVGGAVVTPTLFHAWLDPRWYGAIGPTELMLLSNIPAITFYVASAVLLAVNLQKWEAGVATLQSCSVLLGVVIGGPFGIEASAAAISFISLAIVPLPLFALNRKCGLSAAALLGPQLPASAASVFMGLVVWEAQKQLGSSVSSSFLLPVLVILGIVSYVAALGVFLPSQAGRVIDIIARYRPQI